MWKKFQIMFSISELRKKILLTLALLAVYRLGWNIMLPMVNDQGMHEAFASQTAIFDVMEKVAVFSGTQLDRMTIFGLGIMPYISASIIFQLLATVWAPLEKLQKEGETGRKKINEYTRYATVLICVIQSYAYLSMLNATAGSQMHSGGTQNIFLAPCIAASGHLTFGWMMLAVLVMTTGTTFLMWLGEQIDEYGIGNGISLLIMAGILANAPAALIELWKNATANGGLALGGQFGVEVLLFLAVLFFLVVLGVVFVMKGQRRIPTQSAKHVRGRQVFGGNRQYLPLRVNQAGVMPIIFASSLLLFPQFLFAWLAQYVNTLQSPSNWFLAFVEFGQNIFASHLSWWYVMMDVSLIFFFCYFWTAVTFNPKDMAENLKNHGTFIQGYRPGTRTADYLEKVMIRITYVGAAFLAVIAIVPTIITASMGVSYSIAGFFGGTSLLIAVSVVIDLVDKIDSHLVMRNYKGLLEK
ncbi:MAG: preprotein translocase subunit SecY [Thermoguttaceae bacterium]|nr:preprotein translocase subunit SecY [Thermoguttaceae bacterium]